MVGIHVAAEAARDDANEGNAVAVLGVHVRLDLENEAREFFRSRLDFLLAALARSGWGSQAEEVVEQELNAEIVRGATEKNRRSLPGADGIEIKFRACAFEEFEFIADPFVDIRRERLAHGGVIDPRDRNRSAVGAARGSLEKVDRLLLTIEHAAKFGPVAEWPIHRDRVDAEDGFELIQKLESRAGRAVELVHESENRHSAFAANLEEFSRLRLDALAGVHHHHGGIHGGEHAVGILREILVARRVEEVHHAAVVVELQNGRADRDAALFFQFHPIARGGALVLARGHAAGELNGAAVEQEFFGEGGFSGVGMRDDGKGPASRDFALGDTHISKGFGRRVRSLEPVFVMSTTSSWRTPPRPGM